MAQVREIKKRIQSVRNTQQITRAMQMVASAKLQKAQANLVSARPYTDKLVNVMGRLSGCIGEDYSNPLVEERNSGKEIYVAIAGDRGLCGAYNNNVINLTEKQLKNHSTDEAGLITVGRTAKNYFKKRTYEVVEDYVDLGDIPDFIQARELAREIKRLYMEQEFKKVNLVYTRFKSAISQTPESIPLLPVEPPQKNEEEQDTDYIYEPSEKEVLDILLPRYLETVVYRAVLEAKASEHGARMTAMKNATENADEMIDDLTLSFNRARQEEITTEITEIVGGAAALQK